MKNQTRDEIREAAHQARNRAAVDSWTFAVWAREQAHVLRTKRARTVAAKALRAARLTATVCL